MPTITIDFDNKLISGTGWGTILNKSDNGSLIYYYPSICEWSENAHVWYERMKIGRDNSLLIMDNYVQMDFSNVHFDFLEGKTYCVWICEETNDGYSSYDTDTFLFLNPSNSISFVTQTNNIALSDSITNSANDSFVMNIFSGIVISAMNDSITQSSTDPILFSIVNSSALNGVVKNNNQPIAGATVILFRNNQMIDKQITASDGSFSFQTFEDGTSLFHLSCYYEMNGFIYHSDTMLV